MNVDFVLPSLAMLGLALALGIGRWPLPPKTAIRALTAVAVMTAGTVVLVVVAAAAGFVLGPARRAELVEWCRIVPLHHEIGTLEGLGALLALTVMAVRATQVVYRRRTAARGTAGRRLSIVDTPQPLAYAAPGRPGCVVVSTGMLSALEPRERQVVFAHERAHLRQAHHRYLFLGALAVAVVPFLKPMVEQLRLATERCADEEAVDAIGGDRHLVASAITKAAVTRSKFDGLVPAFGGGSVVARVEALVGTPPSRLAATAGLAVVLASTASAIGAGSVQLHHLWVLVEHICRG